MGLAMGYPMGRYPVKLIQKNMCATLSWSSYFKTQLIDVATKDHFMKHKAYQNLTEKIFQIYQLSYF